MNPIPRIKRPTRGRRLRAGLLAMAVLLSSSISVAAPTRAAGQDALTFGPDGELSATFGANQVVGIDGRITFESNCPEGGIDDWVFPATDVYVVIAGQVSTTGEGELVDAGGGRANTIVSNASLFTDETIAVTKPSGKLGTGAYDVVYDTCQDGKFNPGTDTVFPGAIQVSLPAVLPPASDAIFQMKGAAFVDYLSWLATRFAMQQFFKLADKAIGIQCEVGNAVGCAMKKLDYFDGIKEHFMALMLSEANHFLAIALDPPDPDFDQSTTVGAVYAPFDRSDSAIANASADALLPLATETAISDALLHAVERYQGAVAAGDGAWALDQARQARNLAAVLAAAAPATTAAIGGLRDTIAAEPDLEQALTEASVFSHQIYSYGFDPDERRILLNLGYTTTEIAAIETDLRSEGVLSALSGTVLEAALGDTITAHTATASSAAQAAAAWAAVVAAIEADPAIGGAGPDVDAGGPYSVNEGASLTLHGAAAGEIASAAWDLDADGVFDDATGLEPSTAFATRGVHLVGLRVVAPGGRASVAYAIVNVADTALAPILSNPQPGPRSATVAVGTTRTFSVAASDPDGDPVSFAWTVDRASAPASGPSFSFTPTLADVGLRSVEVQASDGTTGGGSTRRSWDVVVLAPDADGDGWTTTTDCDDAISSVHPTANELLGNEIDDDCDAGTPDAPPGGLTGSMESWGSNHNGSVGTGSYSPTLVASPYLIPGFDDVVQVDSSSTGGVAVTASGRVLGWGQNGSGQLGTSNFIGSPMPISPFAVGGGSGFLSGVTQISGHTHIAARRADGTVVSWGENQSRQVGDGSTVNARLYPVQVLSAAGGPPLSGVRAVETGYVETYAVMDDGTVRAWGQIRCDGGTGVRIEPYPVELDLVGGNVRQVSSGNQWTMFLKNDGTVLSCGALSPTAGRIVPNVLDVYLPKPLPGFGSSSPAIDIAAGLEGGMALKADGSVWAWGFNANGSLSVVAAGGASVPLPVQVPLPPGPPVIDIDMDTACHALALRADGSVLGWGCDFFEQVGDGPHANDLITAAPTVISMPGRSAVSVTNAIWNSLVLTRPIDDSAWERPATWVEASIADVSIGEAAGGAFEVSISAALPQDVAVDWSVVAGTAGEADVELASGTVTIPAGGTSVQVPVPVLDDALDEESETFTIVLANASNGIQLARAQANGTIVDDDAAPSVTVEPATVAEGDTSLTDVAVRVRLSRPSGKPVSVAFATADDSATAPDDYAAASGPVVFAPGQDEAIIHIAARGDLVPEPPESLTVSLSDPLNATLGDSTAAVTINDDEPLVLVVASPEVTEGDSGTTPATFSITLEPAAPSGTTVSVGFSVEGLGATVPDDVIALSGTLEFGPGEGAKQVTVDVVGDTTAETIEGFRLAFEEPLVTGGRIVVPGDNPPASILDDDGGATPPPPPPPAGGAPTVDAGPDVSGAEGSPVALDALVTDPDAGEALSYAWSYAAGDDVDAGAMCVFGDASTVDTSLTCSDDGTYTVSLEATDTAGHTVADAVTVVVTNANPSVDITAPGDLANVGAGSQVNLSAALADPGVSDTHACSIDWGDGTRVNGTVANGRCTGSHAYGAPTVPTVRVVATDDDAGTAEDQLILVITSPATKVNGGGWIIEGASRTSFGFVAAPEGDGFAGEIQILAAGHRFHGHDVTSLDTARPNATWSGTGGWDGADGFTYLVSVADNRNGGVKRASPDTISIEIRDISGAVVFAASGPLQGGNLRVG